jgi:hypothetical protein
MGLHFLLAQFGEVPFKGVAGMMGRLKEKCQELN